MNNFFINTILLGGSVADKISAAHDAGFGQIELWRQDVEAFAEPVTALKARLDSMAVGLTDYQVLLDFDGAPDAMRDAKHAEALRMLDTAVMLGAKTLLVPASTRADCIAGRIDEDMAWLTDAAAERSLRIAYEGMAWSTVNFTLTATWACVQRLNRPNLGLVVDAFHIFARGRTAADLAGIPAERIYLVQLSDLAKDADLQHVVDTARHHRLLPGDGHFPIASITAVLRRIGYAGPVGLEVFNDDMKAQPPGPVAKAGMIALRKYWPG